MTRLILLHTFVALYCTHDINNKACRYFLGVTKQCSNVSSRGDLGWSSREVKQKVESVRLWCRLHNMPERRIVRRVHNWFKGRS